MDDEAGRSEGQGQEVREGEPVPVPERGSRQAWPSRPRVCRRLPGCRSERNCLNLLNNLYFRNLKGNC